MKVAVIRFPGSNCDLDTLHVLQSIKGITAQLLWHQDSSISDFDAVVLPGGFSYGDRLRAGIIAAFSPMMEQVKEFAKDGKPVAGICNGFQTLCEAELLPGALLRNDSLKFICEWTELEVCSSRTPFTKAAKTGEHWKVPIAHGEGRFFAEDSTLKEIEENEMIVFKYVETADFRNPNGSLNNIAGISNLDGNVVGLMPHPERASENCISPFNTKDGRKFFESLLR